MKEHGDGGREGSTEKPYRATGKSAELDHAMAGDTALRAIFEAVAAEIDEAGPGRVVEGVRMPLRLGPATRRAAWPSTRRPDRPLPGA